MAYMSNRLTSEKVIVSAPTSFSGSAQRIWKITNTDNPMLKWFVLVPIALCLIYGCMDACVYMVYRYLRSVWHLRNPIPAPDS